MKGAKNEKVQKKTFAEKVREYRFKRLVNRTYKVCNKYPEHEGCPFAFDVMYQGKIITECKLIKWENGAERYPYEYPSIDEEYDHRAAVDKLIEEYNKSQDEISRD